MPPALAVFKTFRYHYLLGQINQRYSICFLKDTLSQNIHKENRFLYDAGLLFKHLKNNVE